MASHSCCRNWKSWPTLAGGGGLSDGGGGLGAGEGALTYLHQYTWQCASHLPIDIVNILTVDVLLN